MKKSTDRLEDFAAKNRHLRNVRRFEARDGHALSKDMLREAGILDGTDAYSPGALGCAISHMSLWHRVERERSWATICEDDAIFHREFQERSAAMIEQLDHDWDILLWGWNFDSWLGFEMVPGVSSCFGIFDQDRLREAGDRFQNTAITPAAYRLYRAFGTVCYSVSPKGAARLRRHCTPIREMDVTFPGLGKTLPNRGIDIMLNSVYPHVKAYVSFPPLVVTPNERHRSTVQPPPPG